MTSPAAEKVTSSSARSVIVPLVLVTTALTVSCPAAPPSANRVIVPEPEVVTPFCAAATAMVPVVDVRMMLPLPPAFDCWIRLTVIPLFSLNTIFPVAPEFTALMVETVVSSALELPIPETALMTTVPLSAMMSTCVSPASVTAPSVESIVTAVAELLVV